MPTFAVSPTPGTPDHEIGCPEQCSDRQAIQHTRRPPPATLQLSMAKPLTSVETNEKKLKCGKMWNAVLDSAANLRSNGV